MTRTQRLRAALNMLPKGALVSIIIILLGALSTVGYTAGSIVWTERTEVREELRSNSEELRELTKIVDGLVRVVEYNMDLAEDNEAEIKALRENIHKTQLRMERVLARIEADLDK